jgi:hypothetical protein
MKAYEITLRIIDFDGLGPDEIRHVLENARYPNHCIAPKVHGYREADIGEWDDDHPLNKQDTAEDEWSRLFPNQGESHDGFAE